MTVAAAQIRRTQQGTRSAGQGRGGRGRAGRGRVRGRGQNAQPASVLGAPLDADELWLMSPPSDDDEARMDAMFQDEDDDNGGEGTRFLLFNICYILMIN